MRAAIRLGLLVAAIVSVVAGAVIVLTDPNSLGSSRKGPARRAGRIGPNRGRTGDEPQPKVPLVSAQVP